MSPTAIIFSAMTLLAVVGSAVGDGNAAGEFLAQEKRNNEKTRMLAMFPRIGRTKSEDMQKNWRGMRLFPRVGRSGADLEDHGPWCADCIEAEYFMDSLPGKRPNMAAFPRIGRRQLAAFPRVGKRQQRLLATFPRVGRSSGGFPKLEDGNRAWQFAGGNFRLRGQDETYADYANNKDWNEAPPNDDENEAVVVKNASIEDV